MYKRFDHLGIGDSSNRGRFSDRVTRTPRGEHAHVLDPDDPPPRQSWDLGITGMRRIIAVDDGGVVERNQGETRLRAGRNYDVAGSTRLVRANSSLHVVGIQNSRPVTLRCRCAKVAREDIVSVLMT